MTVTLIAIVALVVLALQLVLSSASDLDVDHE